MNSFSEIVLEETLELASRAMASKRVTEDAKVIRGYVAVIRFEPKREHVRTLRMALSDLAEVAKQNQQFFIVARLERISHQLQSLRAT